MTPYIFAQESLAPLDFNPNLNFKPTSKSTLRTTSINLPFFEDFLNYSALPDTNKWADHQVYINNTMGSNMISRGVATFDAINQFGLPYDTLNPNAVRYADSLTSKAIDLSGKKISDSIYLSFFYQPAGIGFAPEKGDSLLLYFRSKSFGRWIKIWSKSDSTLRDFKQIMIPIRDTNYLYNGFQFRFINKASIGVNDDVWNLDYIRLEEGRSIFDTLVNDVAFTFSPSSLLKEYTSMPYRHFLANVIGERSSKFNSNIRNNFNFGQNISNFGYNIFLNSIGTSIASNSDVNRFINANNNSDIEFNTYTSTPSSGFYDKVVFDQQFYLNAPSGDEHPENDTIIGQQIFDNYLAYDDGTAEMSYFLNLFPTLPGKIAVEFNLNQTDTLRGMSIYFGRQVPLAKNKFFNIVVYKKIAYGSSFTDEIIYEFENLQPSYIDTINHFWIYKFDKPIPLPKGIFYLGTIQPALSGSDSLYIGLDRNRKLSNYAYYNVLNTWVPSVISGALMMRPLLGQEIIGSSIKERSIERKNNVNLWPMPFQNLLNFELPNYCSKFEVININGNKIIEGEIFNKTGVIDLSVIPLGVNIIRFLNSGHIQYTREIIKK
jgi:hypothetical protein